MTMQHAVRHPGSGHAFNQCSDTVIAWKFGPMAGMIKYAGGSAWQPGRTHAGRRLHYPDREYR